MNGKELRTMIRNGEADLDDVLKVNYFEITVGALRRRQVRVELDKHEFDYVEHKGLLDSVFVIKGSMTARKFLALDDFVKANS